MITAASIRNIVDRASRLAGFAQVPLQIRRKTGRSSTGIEYGDPEDFKGFVKEGGQLSDEAKAESLDIDTEVVVAGHLGAEEQDLVIFPDKEGKTGLGAQREIARTFKPKGADMKSFSERLWFERAR